MGELCKFPGTDSHSNDLFEHLDPLVVVLKSVPETQEAKLLRILDLLPALFKERRRRRQGRPSRNLRIVCVNGINKPLDGDFQPQG